MVRHAVHNPTELQRACDVVEAGDQVFIYGGIYDVSSILHKRKGEPGRPIVFAAADEQWISGAQVPDPFWGGTLPSVDAPRKPDVSDFALLLIDDCEHIAVERLKIGNCWPTILFVKDTKFLRVRGCVLRHGTYAIFAKGDTSHLLIEENEWLQDDSPGHDLWNKIDWRRAHGGEGADGLFRYFNGGFLSAKGIAGNVVVRRNRISDAFNGVRMKADSAYPNQSPPRNANVHIFDNDFIRIRDNPVEPEVFAFDWHVRHNRLLDCHAWFSFDGVTGGYWYFYGNFGGFRSRQGGAGGGDHTTGRVLKLSYETFPRDMDSERVPAFPWFVFNNSWRLRCPVIAGRNDMPHTPGAEGPDFTAHLDFFNNAFEWCDPSRDGPWICEHIDLMYNFDLSRSANVRFDFDITNRQDFFDYFAAAGHDEEHGCAARMSVFEPSQPGILRLAAGSPGLNSGSVRGVARPDDGAARLRPQADGTLNRGAVQDYGNTEVPVLEAQAIAIIAQFRELNHETAPLVEARHRRAAPERCD